MSTSFPNVTNMSAILISHEECLSHLFQPAFTEFEASDPSFTSPFNNILNITVELGQIVWKYSELFTYSSIRKYNIMPYLFYYYHFPVILKTIHPLVIEQRGNIVKYLSKHITIGNTLKSRYIRRI